MKMNLKLIIYFSIVLFGNLHSMSPEVDISYLDTQIRESTQDLLLKTYVEKEAIKTIASQEERRESSKQLLSMCTPEQVSTKAAPIKTTTNQEQLTKFLVNTFTPSETTITSQTRTTDLFESSRTAAALVAQASAREELLELQAIQAVPREERLAEFEKKLSLEYETRIRDFPKIAQSLTSHEISEARVKCSAQLSNLEDKAFFVEKAIREAKEHLDSVGSSYFEHLIPGAPIDPYTVPKQVVFAKQALEKALHEELVFKMHYALTVKSQKIFEHEIKRRQTIITNNLLQQGQAFGSEQKAAFFQEKAESCTLEKSKLDKEVETLTQQGIQLEKEIKTLKKDNHSLFGRGAHLLSYFGIGKSSSDKQEKLENLHYKIVQKIKHNKFEASQLAEVISTCDKQASEIQTLILQEKHTQQRKMHDHVVNSALELALTQNPEKREAILALYDQFKALPPIQKDATTLRLLDALMKSSDSNGQQLPLQITLSNKSSATLIPESYFVINQGLEGNYFQNIADKLVQNAFQGVSGATQERLIESSIATFRDKLLRKYPDRNQEIGLFFKNLASLPDTQKIASAFRFSSDLMTHESLNVKHATSPEEPTAQHLDTLIARAFNQSIAYEKHLMNDDPSVQHNLLEKTLRVITKSMFGAAQNIIAMPGNVRVLGSQLRHHPIDTTGTIAKAVCHKVGTVFYTVGSFLNALNTIKVRHDTLINKENCEFIEAFNPGWTAALEEEQKIDCRAIADTIASFSEEDMQKYIVQPFIEAHMVAGILKTAKAIHPVARKLATAAEIESDQPGGSWRTPQELGDLVRHRFTTQAESELLVPELVTHVPTTARSLDKLLPSRFVPPASAQPGFLDISGKIAGGLAVNRLTTRADLEELVGNQIEQASKLTFTIPEKIMELAPTTKQYPRLDGEHMYTPTVKFHNKTGNPLKPSGLHIDPNGILETSGLVKIERIDKIKLINEYYTANISINGGPPKSTALFPQHYTENDIYKTIQSCLDNANPKDLINKANGDWEISGIAHDGTPIACVYKSKSNSIHGYFYYEIMKKGIAS